MALSRAPVAKPALGGSAVKAAAPSKAPLKVAALPRPVETVKAAAENVAQAAGKMAAVLATTALVAGSANALTFDELQSLSYLEVKGTGLANVCPVVGDGAGDAKSLKSGSFKMAQFCLEPTSFEVKEESQFKGGNAEFVPTKLMTRLTYTLTGMEGSFAVNGDSVTLKENDDGINFAPVTVQLPGGERVPFLFTAKNLEAKGKADGFEGSFVVPAYRGSSFLDPKGRGGSTGYDNAVALPARSDAEEFLKENNKVVAPMVGKMRLSVAAYNKETGEVGGVFESVQPSDTDLGSKEPKDIKITGLWYAQLE